jgi:hypothetical protein
MSIRHVDVADGPAQGKEAGKRWPSFGSKRGRQARRSPSPGPGGTLAEGEGEGDGEGDGDASRARPEHLGLRLLRILVLLACYFVLELAVKAVMVVQLLFVAWRRRPHALLQRAGGMLAQYMQELWGYCTFASDHAPWPFGPWPRP